MKTVFIVKVHQYLSVLISLEENSVQFLDDKFIINFNLVEVAILSYHTLEDSLSEIFATYSYDFGSDVLELFCEINA